VVAGALNEPGRLRCLYKCGSVNSVDSYPKRYEAEDGGSFVSEKDLELIRDVDMTVSVELGRTKKLFKEILDMKPGTVIELDTSTGDRIDFLVNKKLVARGEVMVIDGKYALRVTDIVGSIPEAVKQALSEGRKIGA